MRLFIAGEISGERFSGMIEELSKISGLKTVEPGNMHLTLKFLGETDEGKVSGIKEVMAECVKGKNAFEIKLEDVGVFPNPNYIRVVWAGITENRDILIDMANCLDKGLAKLGFPREKRAFSPHLTLARVKSPGAKNEINRFLKTHEGEDFGTMKIDRVILKKSVLTPQGPIYTDVFEVGLG